MSDLIDRQAAIEALDEQIEQCDKALSSFDISMRDEFAVKAERASLVAFRETLEYLPPAEPKRGKWIRTGSGSLYDHYECSECGKAPKWECMGDNRWKIAFTDFCPNCGADMRGEQDG